MTRGEAVMQMVIVYLHDAGGHEEAESETQEAGSGECLCSL